MKVVAIIAAFNEEDIIGQVVGALIDEGVQVYFIDHLSTDGTVAEVARYQGLGVIGIESFPDGASDNQQTRQFAWTAILRRKEALAASLDADWFIHHDADEFRESPWSGVSLNQAIHRVDRAGYNAIDFQLLNFHPTTDDIGRTEDVRRSLTYYEPGQYWDQLQIKCWKKTEGPVDLVASGGHVAAFEGQRVFPIRFLLRHYPIRGQAHGERKVFKERIPRFEPAERARGWHVQYEQYREGTSFLREPASLIKYDAEAVRLNLLLKHRDIERLQRVAAAHEELCRRLKDAFATIQQRTDEQDRELASVRRSLTVKDEELETSGRHIELQDGELQRLRPCVAAQEKQLADLRQHLQSQDAELARLRPLATAQDAQLSELRVHLADQDAELGRLRPLVSGQEAQLEELRRHLGDQNTELDRLRPRLASQDAELESLRIALDQRVHEIDALRAQNDRCAEEALRLHTAITAVEKQIAEILSSRSWKITQPLRTVQQWLTE